MATDLRNLLVNRIHDGALARRGAQYLTGRMLDVGCGRKPYRPLLAPYVAEHLGVDHEVSPHGLQDVDLVGSAYQVPVPSGSFDSLLCTAVLEHLEEPETAIREAARVLRDGGVALYTVPFIWQLHEEPRDFFRYSKYGLRHLFEKCGFEVLELDALSGFWVTFGQMLVYNIHRANRGPLRWLRIVDAVGLVIQGVAYLLDRLDRTEQWTWAYLVVARKRVVAETE